MDEKVNNVKQHFDNTRNQMNVVATVFQEVIARVFNRVDLGFVILIYEHNTTNPANYASNSKREDIIKSLGQLIEQLKGNTDVSNEGELKDG